MEVRFRLFIVAIFLIGSLFSISQSHAAPVPPECFGVVECTADKSKVGYSRMKTDNKKMCEQTKEDTTQCKVICDKKKSQVKSCKVNPKPVFHNNTGEGTL